MKTCLTALRLLFCLAFVALYSCKPSVSPAKNNISEDSLFSQIRVLLSRYQWKDAIALNGNYIKNAHENHDRHSVVLGYINIGNIYYLHNDYQQSLSFLKKAAAEKDGLNDAELDTRLYNEYANVYHSLRLDDKAREYFGKAFEAVRKIVNPKRLANALWYLYGTSAEYYDDRKQYDSMLQCLSKAFQIRPEPSTPLRLAAYFLTGNKLDSTRFYLLKADSLFDKGDYPPYYKGLILQRWGNLDMAEKDFDGAISNYLNASDIFGKEHRIHNLSKCYILLSQACQKKGDSAKSYEFLEKHTVLSDSISNAKQDAISISVKDIQEQYVEQYNSGKRKILWLITGLSFLAVLAGALVSRRIKTGKQIASKLLVQKDELLAQKEKESLALQQKVNDSFDELIELAKQNNPNFYTRFREIYPEWHKKIMETAPGITLTELTLCAYIYLDFQTKEIAELTSKSIRTIQHGKYIIRKKLKIDSDVDIYLWLKNLNA